MQTENKKLATAPTQTEPAFWLRHTHAEMREHLNAMVRELKNVPPQYLGELPGAASGLLQILDDLTKMTTAGFSMQPPSPPVAPPEDSIDNDPMESRVLKLEDFALDTRDRLTRIETRLDATATKADLAILEGSMRTDMHRGFGDVVKWVVGTAVGLGVAGITVMTFMLNNAAPKTPTQAQPPIIINVPASVPAAQPPAPPSSK